MQPQTQTPMVSRRKSQFTNIVLANKFKNVINKMMRSERSNTINNNINNSITKFNNNNSTHKNNEENHHSPSLLNRSPPHSPKKKASPKRISMKIMMNPKRKSIANFCSLNALRIQERDPMDEQIERLATLLTNAQNKKETNDEGISANQHIFDNKRRELINRIFEKENSRHKNDGLSVIDVIVFLMKKTQKNDIDHFILKNFFLQNEKLITLLTPLNINIHDMMSKLVTHIKLDLKLKNNILFKEGDKGDKLYILLKGLVGVFIHKEMKFSFSKVEYIKYLITLHIYQENSLVSKIINLNQDIFCVDTRNFFAMVDTFKFYRFFAENDRLKDNIKNIIDFIVIEEKVHKYINKKNDLPEKETFNVLCFDIITIQDLYLFYDRKIDLIKNNIFKKEITQLEGDNTTVVSNMSNKNNPNLSNNPKNEKRVFHHSRKELLGEKRGKVKRTSIFCIPTTFQEMTNLLNLYESLGKKFKNDDDLYDKLSNTKAIPSNNIYQCSINEYFHRSDPITILKYIKKDLKNNIPINLHTAIYDAKEEINCYQYVEANQLSDGNIFGELALINPNKQRTATVIIKEDSYFGTISKQVYDLSIRAAQDKLRIRNVLFFTNGPVFKGIPNSFFLSNFFYRFKKLSIRKGDCLFRRGEFRDKIYFIIKGELQLSGNMTLMSASEIISSQSPQDTNLNDKEVKKLCEKNYEFKKFYQNNKINIKVYVLKDREVAGLDDMVMKNIHLFDCICVSSEKTEVYELEYPILQNALREKNLKKNVDEYVDIKKQVLINRLYIQRNALALSEYKKIFIFCSQELSKQEQMQLQNLSNNNINTIGPMKYNQSYNISLSDDENSILPKMKKFSKFECNFTQYINFKKEKRKYHYLNILQKFFKQKITKEFFPKKYKKQRQREKEREKEHSLSNNSKKQMKSVNNNTQMSFGFERRNIFEKEKVKLISNNSISNNNDRRLQTLSNNIQSKENPQNHIRTRTYGGSKMENSFKKYLKPLIPRTLNSRRTKKIVHFFSQNNSNQRYEGTSSPYVMKKFSQNFVETRTPLQAKNFFIENQNIFNSLLKMENDYQNGNNNNNGNISSWFNNTSINNFSDNNNISSNINNSNIAPAISQSFFLNNQNNNNNTAGKEENIRNIKFNKIGFIDCLCLDKWEEKKNSHNKHKKMKKLYK